MVCKHCEFYRKGTFHSTQNSGNFGWYIKSNRPFRFGLTRIFRTSGGPLWLVRSFRLLGPKSPFQFDKIVVPSTSFLFPAYENNIKPNAWWLGLGLCNGNVPFHWAHEISEISNQIFPTHFSNFFVSPGSVEVSGWLTTYPSPESNFFPKKWVSVNCDLGEG